MHRSSIRPVLSGKRSTKWEGDYSGYALVTDTSRKIMAADRNEDGVIDKEEKKWERSYLYDPNLVFIISGMNNPYLSRIRIDHYRFERFRSA